jgi:hypothetical protein
MAKNMYGISVNGAIVSTVADATIASTIASAVGGVVVEVSKAQAGAFVKSATAAPNVPPRFAELLKSLKHDIKAELEMTGDAGDTCFEFTMRYDAHVDKWYISVKDLARGKTVYHKDTGERYDSMCHVRWEKGLACTVKYLAAQFRDADGKADYVSYNSLAPQLRDRVKK